MKIKTTVDVKKVLIYGVLVFLVFSIAYTAIRVIIMSNDSKDLANQIENTEEQLVNVEKSIMSSKANRLISDVLYISDTISISGFDEKMYNEKRIIKKELKVVRGEKVWCL